MKALGTSAILPRSFRKQYPVAVRAEGAWIWDADGKRYFDLAGSAAVNFIGHGDPSVAKSLSAQAAQLEFVHSSQFSSNVAEEFAEEVLAFAGDAFDGGAVFFTCGGSETVETALKLARQYQVEIGQGSRTKFLSRHQAYHGATLGAMAVSGNRKRREIYMPLLQESPKVNLPYCYRCIYGCQDCGSKYAAEVEQALTPEFAGFIFEPVSGATLGAVAPPHDYLQRVAEICQANDALLVADEVMTGFGRTGRNFAVDHWGIKPDLLLAAKGIASGYAPLGAVIANRKVVEAIRNGSGALVHGFTYNAHPVAIAAGRSSLDVIMKRGLVHAASDEGAAGAALKTALQDLRDCPGVGDVRGIGLLWGVEFVADRSTKKPFDPALQFSSKVAAAASRRGVMTYPMQGCVDGISGDHLLIAPPAISSPQDIQWATEQLKSAIHEAELSSR
ncbi:MAG TPA: aminotransferase class III-fold pyridoxal phosphate-dependent enzyme [Terriglobales bacterium]